jgi:sugar phosphate isomerase/epimerase
MKPLFLALLAAASAGAADPMDHLGLQLYSLRVLEHSQGWRAELDEARDLGFRYVEGGTPPRGVSPSQYLSELGSRGLRMVSMGFSYDDLSRDPAGCVARARELGVSFVMCAWIPHGDVLTEADATKAASDFEACGAAFRAAGITFTYHPHGYEFRPRPDGTTLFDVLVGKTNPSDVSFELDVFWAEHAGQDPVRLMKRYPGRWRLLHLKDIRRGAETGLYSGHAPETDDVPLGTGQVDWTAVLREARAQGISWYFIEDESPTPTESIPKSIRYLRTLNP